MMNAAQTNTMSAEHELIRLTETSTNNRRRNKNRTGHEEIVELRTKHQFWTQTRTEQHPNRRHRKQMAKDECLQSNTVKSDDGEPNKTQHETKKGELVVLATKAEHQQRTQKPVHR